MDVSQLTEGLYVSVMAMAVVFFVLAVIALVMVILGRVVRAAETSARPAAAPVPVRSSGPASGLPGGVDEETVAAIVGALTQVMQGRRFRVASIGGYDIQTARWAMAGRQRLLKRG